MKKYLPVTYVDENGEIWTKEKLSTKIYKKHEREQHKQKEVYGTYIHTIQRISEIQEAPRQLDLF